MFKRLALGVVCVLAGCNSASVSQNQCLAGDWQTLGYADGVAGFLSTRLLEHQNSCGKYDVVPDREAYLAGFEEGLATYCKPANGFAVGQRGGGYHHGCPANLEGSFFDAYHEGQSLYRAQRSVTQLRRKIYNAEQTVKDLDAEITDTAAAQLDPDLTAQERISLFTQLKEASEERDEIRDQLPYMKDKLTERELELAALRQTFALVDY